MPFLREAVIERAAIKRTGASANAVADTLRPVARIDCADRQARGLLREFQSIFGDCAALATTKGLSHLAPRLCMIWVMATERIASAALEAFIDKTIELAKERGYLAIAGYETEARQGG